jgi:serine/threonine protein kinase
MSGRSADVTVEFKLERTWQVGERIGSGGFGRVHVVNGDDGEAVAKFVPKEPGADRELLFVDLAGVANVVPVIDRGEHGDDWVLVMPRADRSLREEMDSAGGALKVDDATAIIKDIAEALAALDGRVVHRDLKPENVLLLDSRWCLADFGISRYAEASTAPDTRKYAMTPAYAAPERWRHEHATIAADVYALGVIAHELISGNRPFNANSVDDLREQHLHEMPPTLPGASTAFATLVDECLFKAPESRPSPANFLARLERQRQRGEQSAGLAQLEAANQNEVQRRAVDTSLVSAARTESERRSALAISAENTFRRISSRLREAIAEAASSAIVSSRDRDGGWSANLGQATLRVSSCKTHQTPSWGGWQGPAFDVVCTASINVRIPPNAHGYEGRSHSLWFADIQRAGEYAWFETAFMISPLIAKRGRQDPFALGLGEESAKAVWNGMAEYQVAWPFTRLDADDLDEFIDRWASWFASAASGALDIPSTMPEKPTQGTWRSVGA